MRQSLRQRAFGVPAAWSRTSSRVPLRSSRTRRCLQPPHTPSPDSAGSAGAFVALAATHLAAHSAGRWQDLRDRGFDRITKLSRGQQPALDYLESPVFLDALRKRQGFAARALEITILTGLKTGEVIGARWTEIDLDRQIWVIPADRLKDRRTRSEPHRVPLSTDVVELLNTMSRLGEFVFPGQTSGKPLSNMAMLSVMKDMNRAENGKPLWVDPRSGRPITPHGLRATFRTWGEDAGFARELLEEALGHQVGSAVERAYRRTDSFDRRRTVMQAWADYCHGRPVQLPIDLAAGTVSSSTQPRKAVSGGALPI